ncbi:MAG: aminotransferase class I/II-fold pyridoxal phosphate-dependent enzyme [Candidatus Marinimicrobia bacterium]|nr:aminotransferase class I/II-fold pyridoxal phosphate-dependent enzyme [Candidatus Neomarinimicrobiota bacterium]
MSKLDNELSDRVRELKDSGSAKGREHIITAVIPPEKDRGPRYHLKGFRRDFIRMNSNSYLGLSLHPKVIKAGEEASRRFGAGPGAVRFISGSYQEHIDLERTIGDFHRKEAAMIFSSAYVTSLGVIASLATPETVVISDALNHNCIINGLRMSRPGLKMIYEHNNMKDLKDKIRDAFGKGRRCLVITDGIFSMRGDHAPLDVISALCKDADAHFEEGASLIVDDSHGAGACGKTGRGTEELTGASADILIGTLGKAFGVNGGYVTGSKTLITYLRESAPTYVYSNPITVAESAAAKKSIEILQGEEGQERLAHLKKATARFREGLKEAGFETIAGEHPVVPLMVRDTQKTADLVDHLHKEGILATGLNFPVVPKGEEEIRFQVCADHTSADIDHVLDVLKKYTEQ